MAPSSLSTVHYTPREKARKPTLYALLVGDRQRDPKEANNLSNEPPRAKLLRGFGTCACYLRAQH